MQFLPSSNSLFNFIMIIGFEQADINTWKADLHSYEHRKRNLFPTHKQAERQFMPSPTLKTHPKPMQNLQKYHSTELPSRAKQQINDMDRSLKKYMLKQFNYEKPYDIITLHPLEEVTTQSAIEKPKKIMAPIRNIYNPINGLKLSEEFLKNRSVILPPKHNKMELDRSRDFNIVNLEYKQDNIARQKQDEAKLQQQIKQKCKATHVYDNIYNRYYNPEEEEKYWTHKKQENVNKSNMNFDVKLPPSYQTRERYIQDYSKPLPESMKRLDQRRQNNKRSHQIKYIFEQRYKMKNMQEADRRQLMTYNRVHHHHKINKSLLAPASIKSVGFD